LKELTAEYKEDLWRIPADTYILTVKFILSMQAAQEIVMRCRELHRLVIDGHVWASMKQDVKDYLTKNVHVEVSGSVEGHGVSLIIEKKIRQTYDLGHKSIHQLSLDYNLPYEVVKKILEGK